MEIKTKCIYPNVMIIGLEGSYSEGYLTPPFVLSLSILTALHFTKID